MLRQVRLELVPQLKEAVIQLHPAELGRISIRLTIEDEGLVARVRAEKREALDALERHLPELRAALSRQGVETQHVDLALGFHDERRANEGRSDRSQRGRPNRDEDSVTNAGELSPRLRRMASSGGIDTYA
ncbi:MAG: flagellar hook-length control protein FliK [Planctomycetes bacterium]|nr:flagellar hook-length control protein FliK [Planctomycetota bacterium]